MKRNNKIYIFICSNASSRVESTAWSCWKCVHTDGKGQMICIKQLVFLTEIFQLDLTWLLNQTENTSIKLQSELWRKKRRWGSFFAVYMQESTTTILLQADTFLFIIHGLIHSWKCLWVNKNAICSLLICCCCIYKNLSTVHRNKCHWSFL